MLRLRDEKCRISLAKESNPKDSSFIYRGLFICEPLNPKGCPKILRKFKLERTCFIEV